MLMDVFDPVPPKTAEAYEQMLARRSRPRVAGARKATSPNQAGRPYPFCVIQGAARIPLPPTMTSNELRIGQRPEATDAARSKRISVSEVSDLLLLSSGILKRKLSITWNKTSRPHARYSRLQFSRGVPSGGGLYPCCTYLIALTAHVLRPGVYHYDAVRHGLDRIRVGQYCSHLEAILDCEVRNQFDFFFVLASRFERSAFKYGHFAYKVIMQDVGALLGGMEQIAFCLNWNTTVFYSFTDRLMANLLGLDERFEAPFVVLGVRSAQGAGIAPAVPESGTPGAQLLTAFEHRERTHNVGSLGFILDIHRSTMIQQGDQRARTATLTPPRTLEEKLRPISGRYLVPALLSRETAWGQITDRLPDLSLEKLLAVIVFACSAGAYATDFCGRAGQLPLLRAEVLVRRVTGLPPGLYRYDSVSAELVDHRGPSYEQILRKSFPRHHDIDHVPVVVLLVGKLREVVDTFGQRGIRAMNAEAGIFAQRAYLACAASSLGCGAVLGFDASVVAAALKLDWRTEVPLLAILMGPRKPRAVAFDFQLPLLRS